MQQGELDDLDINTIFEEAECAENKLVEFSFDKNPNLLWSEGKIVYVRYQQRTYALSQKRIEDGIVHWKGEFDADNITPKDAQNILKASIEVVKQTL